MAIAKIGENADCGRKLPSERMRERERERVGLGVGVDVNVEGEVGYILPPPKYGALSLHFRAFKGIHHNMLILCKEDTMAHHNKKKNTF